MLASEAVRELSEMIAKSGDGWLLSCPANSVSATQVLSLEFVRAAPVADSCAGPAENAFILHLA